MWCCRMLPTTRRRPADRRQFFRRDFHVPIVLFEAQKVGEMQFAGIGHQFVM